MKVVFLIKSIRKTLNLLDKGSLVASFIFCLTKLFIVWTSYTVF